MFASGPVLFALPSEGKAQVAECTAQRTYNARELGAPQVSAMKMVMSAAIHAAKAGDIPRTSGLMNFTKPLDPSLGEASPLFRLVIDYYDTGNSVFSAEHRKPFLRNMIVSMEVDAAGLGTEERPLKLLQQTEKEDGSGRAYMLHGIFGKQQAGKNTRSALFNPLFIPLPDKDTLATLALITAIKDEMMASKKITATFIDAGTNETIGYSSMPLALGRLERFDMAATSMKLRMQFADSTCRAVS
ncbi:MAG: hypothetical protein HC843_03145 [Sphingomonadales bacterium]|nr:hypothetical protein [Sphingomonadales bacterium]